MTGLIILSPFLFTLYPSWVNTMAQRSRESACTNARGERRIKLFSSNFQQPGKFLELNFFFPTLVKQKRLFFANNRVDFLLEFHRILWGVATRGEMFALVSRTLGSLEQLVNSKIHLLNPVRDPLSIPITCQEGISKKAGCSENESYWQAVHAQTSAQCLDALIRFHCLFHCRVHVGVRWCVVSGRSMAEARATAKKP